MQKTDLLMTFVKDVYCLGRDIEASTQGFYVTKVKRFSRFLGRPATIADLNDLTINRYLTARLEQVERATVHGERSTLLAIWREAYVARIPDVDNAFDRVKKIKRLPKIVEGWTDEQLGRLLSVINRQRGRFKGKRIERAKFWLAVVRTLYDTGLRLGDLFRLEAKQLLSGPMFTVVQHKTSKVVDVQLSPETIAAIREISPLTRKRPFGDVLYRRYFFIKFRELCQEADLDGRTKKLRITSGSRVEGEYPGEGHIHLGNGRHVFEQHYHWRAVTKRPVRLPPQLGA